MPGIAVGIDTGGTFTDGFFVGKAGMQKVKVDTTPHDLTVCFIECLKEGAEKLGFSDLRSFLKEVSVVRFSSTTATNVVVQRIGSKTGSLVSPELREALPRATPDWLIDVSEVATSDSITLESEEKFVDVVKQLLDQGARSIVISFSNRAKAGGEEQKAKQVIRQVFPRHYLGSVPLTVASEFCDHPDEIGRTNLALLNAYVHSSVSRTLYKAEDKLRDNGYKKPLLIVHSDGGCARVAKTKAIDTVGSSPLAGLNTCLYWAKEYGISRAVSIDVGGTSLDIGIINGDGGLRKAKELFDMRIAVPMIAVHSYPLGGGSIATVKPSTKDVRVGPESAGAIPGPACYGLGGERATVTDADVVIGRINPEYFLGGKRRLDQRAAYEAIKTHMAQPLGTEVMEAANMVIEEAARTGAHAVRNEITGAGQPSSAQAEFALFALGGAGPTHCCEMAEVLGINTIYTFPWSSVAGAFGTSLMDISHVYMKSLQLPLLDGGRIVLDADRFNRAIEDLQLRAIRDMRGEGIEEKDVLWEVELEIQPSSGPSITIGSPAVLLSNQAEVARLADACSNAIPASTRNGKTSIEVLYVRSMAALTKYSSKKYEKGSKDPSSALKGHREVHPYGSDVPVYTFEKLAPGNVLVGPAIIEGQDTTHVVPPVWQFEIDGFGNGVIRHD